MCKSAAQHAGPSEPGRTLAPPSEHPFLHGPRCGRAGARAFRIESPAGPGPRPSAQRSRPRPLGAGAAKARYLLSAGRTACAGRTAPAWAAASGALHGVARWRWCHVTRDPRTPHETPTHRAGALASRRLPKQATVRAPPRTARPQHLIAHRCALCRAR
ncbi:LAFE_0H16556g1_1 [Lachancea fermentati]|uniref:LAFE_0H16556g1_1 n=1 Tax=Lachancea fermentati TaxID=4955 RepID=A0A1G4ML48_LACFM|nr:LAFE_0H16556g1_1 [Lachancea fermentati]